VTATVTAVHLAARRLSSPDFLNAVMAPVTQPMMFLLTTSFSLTFGDLATTSRGDSSFHAGDTEILLAFSQKYAESNPKAKPETVFRSAARCRHGLEARWNSFAGLVELNRCASVRKIQAVRAATLQQTMPGAVRQPAGLKAMPTTGLEALAGHIFVVVVSGKMDLR